MQSDQIQNENAREEGYVFLLLGHQEPRPPTKGGWAPAPALPDFLKTWIFYLNSIASFDLD